jgi:hypothetical protein
VRLVTASLLFVVSLFEFGRALPRTLESNRKAKLSVLVQGAVMTDGLVGADEKELSTVAKRFLIAEINRLVEENQQLKQFKEKYHDVDKKLAVLKETIKPFRRYLFLSSVCLIAGSVGVAMAPSFLSINQYGWYVFVSVSALLLIAGIAARVEEPSTGATTR